MSLLLLFFLPFEYPFGLVDVLHDVFSVLVAVPTADLSDSLDRLELLIVYIDVMRDPDKRSMDVIDGMDNGPIFLVYLVNRCI